MELTHGRVTVRKFCEFENVLVTTVAGIKLVVDLCRAAEGQMAV